MNPLIVMVREKDKDYDIEVCVERVPDGIDLGIDDNVDMSAWVTLTVDDAERIANGLLRAIAERKP